MLAQFKLLYERGAGMSRILQHMEKSDCAILTAFRGQYSNAENRERNKALLADLRSFGYGPIDIEGTYQEEILDDQGNGLGKTRTVTEESFFVPELFGAHGALDTMLDLGRKYEQDAILYILHPMQREDEQVVEAVIYGTSDGRSISSEVIPIGQLTLAKIGDIYSKIHQTKFSFVDEPEEVQEAYRNMMRPDGLANAYLKREFLKKVFSRD